MTIAVAVAAGVVFGLVGAGAERLASVWPADEAQHRRPGWRTVGLAVAAGLAGGSITWRSSLPPWATAAMLGLLALMVVLVATDLEQRRLPHLALDPLLAGSAVLVPFHPTLPWTDALLGAGVAVAFLGGLALVIRGGLALGDLYLVAALGLVLGWPAIITALFAAGLLSATVSIGLLVSRRVGLRSYIPFGPFLIAGAVIALLRDPFLLGPAASAVARAVAGGM